MSSTKVNGLQTQSHLSKNTSLTSTTEVLLQPNAHSTMPGIILGRRYAIVFHMQYLINEPERIQSRSLEIIRLPSDALQFLEQRRVNLAIYEYTQGRC